MQYQVRGDEKHPFSVEEATDPKSQFAFKVDPVPVMDWAAKALHEAQDKYLASMPPARRSKYHPEDLLWTIEKVDPE